MSAVSPIGIRVGYDAWINYLQRAELDEQGQGIPPIEIRDALSKAPDLATPIQNWLVEVRGLACLQQAEPSSATEKVYQTRDILAGLHGQSLTMHFLVRGERSRVRLYLGMLTLGGNEGKEPSVRAVFASQYPGLRLWPEKDPNPSWGRLEEQQIERQWQEAKRDWQIRPFLDRCQYLGVVTGVPTPNVGAQNGIGTQIDRLIRGLYGTEWAFLVLAEPEVDLAVVEMQKALLKEQMRVEEDIRSLDSRENVTRTLAYYYGQLLQMRYQFLESCLFEGGWWVQSYLASPDPVAYQRGKALIKSIFSGEFSRVDRIRVLDCPGAGRRAAGFSPIMADRPGTLSSELEQGMGGGGGKLTKYRTLVSSGQLSALFHLPRVEMPGYFVRESAHFDVSSHVPAGTPSITVGEIFDRDRPTGNAYRVPVEELTKHCLLVGITGGGKSNTAKHLFRQFQELSPSVPVLVIEPAKREYRQLAKLLPPGKELRVFTVGEEHQDAAPFRLNPFEIRPGVNVQTHIDLLKSVFNASFGMWSPLPQVLERAIHEIYRDKGWDPVRGTNERATITSPKGVAWHSFAQPTLTDLYRKVSDLVPRLGYNAEVERNVRTALETRINGLRIGAKGLMLDTPSSIPIEHLLSDPTVLELEGVGDDDEKAFIIGLILMALYEYYRTPGRPATSALRHITIIEEAHRLLTNVRAGSDPESTNLKGKAVETFVNMLSEVRAYGEGFIVAEQIPTKLAPDVIKNTALKIMHRIVSADDRQVMGGTMNLEHSQLRQVVALSAGEAVVHGGGQYGDDNAILVKVPEVKGGGSVAPTGPEIRRGWECFKAQYNLGGIFLSYPTCLSYCRPPNDKCADARLLAEDQAIDATTAAFILTIVAGSALRSKDGLGALLPAVYADLGRGVRARLIGRHEDPAHMRCIVTHALSRCLQEYGVVYDWRYEGVEQLIALALPATLAVAVGMSVESTALESLGKFCQAFRDGCLLDYEPFYGCNRVCDRPRPCLCLYRYHIAPLTRSAELIGRFQDAGTDWPELALECETLAQRVLSLPADPRHPLRVTGDDKCFQDAGLCFAIQLTHSNPITWSVLDRKFIIDKLLEHYSR